MALDTNLIEEGLVKDGANPDAEKYFRQKAQEAFKDINETLEPAKKINPIMAHDKLGRTVIDNIGPLVGVEEDGVTPKWTDPRAGNLKQETVELYNFLATHELFQEVEAEGGEQEQAQAAGTVQESPAEPQEAVETEAEGSMTGESEVIKTEWYGAAEPRKKREPKAKEARYGYMDAVVDAIRSGSMDRKALARKVLDLYNGNGGSGDLKQAERNLNTALRPLLIIGAVKDDGGKIVINEALA